MDLRIIDVAGEDVALHPMGAAYVPAHKTLVVADLHFEKGSAFGARGVFLPPYDTKTTLRRLSALCVTLEPRCVVSLGDAFHDAAAEARMEDDDARLLDQLVDGRRWIWILGNHDAASPDRFGGETHLEARFGRFVFRHEASRDEGRDPALYEMSGHYHPCALIGMEGRSQRRRCFLADHERMILPAFGAYAGGLNVLDKAYADVFVEPVTYALGRRGVYSIPRARLLPDPPAPARLCVA